MKKLKKIAILCMILLFIFIFTICSYILIKNLLDYKEVESKTEKLKEVVIEPNENQDKDDVAIDWEKIKNINPDIIGWIKIEDTNIDYPIMQDKDLYYMNHTYERKYNINGSIFTKVNNPFESKITTVYGHNNKNGLMFAGIEKFMNEEFFLNHNTFKIYTESKIYDAKIFSIYSIGVKEESTNIKNLGFEESIEYYKKQSEFKANDINTPEKIVKLSTCSYLNNKVTPTNQRYFLVASLVENK